MVQKLGLVGFVLGLFFASMVHSYLFVVRCFNRSCVHLGFWEIGFVLQKNRLICRGFSTDVEGDFVKLIAYLEKQGWRFVVHSS